MRQAVRAVAKDFVVGPRVAIRNELETLPDFPKGGVGVGLAASVPVAFAFEALGNGLRHGLGARFACNGLQFSQEPVGIFVAGLSRHSA